MKLQRFQEKVQEVALPAVWNRGVKLAKEAEWILVYKTNDELKLQCRLGNQAVSPQIILWPSDEDWHCDCGDKADPCMHIAGAVLAVKSGAAKPLQSGSKINSTILQYDFSERDGFLTLERLIVSPKGVQKLTQSLTALVGGGQSGRTLGVPTAFSKADFAVDHVLLATHNWNLLDRESNAKLWQRLVDCENIHFQGKAIRLRRQAFGFQLLIQSSSGGIKFSVQTNASAKKRFANGFALLDKELALVQSPSLTREEESWLARGKEKPLSLEESQYFLSEIYPSLNERLDCELCSKWELIQESPRVVLHLQEDGPERLQVIPKLVYGSPTLAERRGTALHFVADKQIPLRNKEAEEQEIIKLRQGLGVPLDQVSAFSRDEALGFLDRAIDYETRGSGAKHFKRGGELRLDLQWQDDNVRATFSVGNKRSTRTDAQQALQAWREGKKSLPLGDGLWLKLPLDWFAKYGDRLEKILRIQEGGKGKLPRHQLPEIADLCESAGCQVPEMAARLRFNLENLELNQAPQIPEHLQPLLRPYQRQGIAWLQNLRTLDLGALLADDMGLGKTLQAICSIQGKTLVVAPTSVIFSWAEQIDRFSPDKKFNLYHGKSRKWHEDQTLVITSYTLLRQEVKQFQKTQWDTLVLDEAQNIKNPDSLAAQACQQIPARWRLALTGTPVENELKDIWSIFQVLNPGILGTRAEFAELSGPEGAAETKRRIGPFILRRRKEEVAKDLPPRLESTLYTELREEERAHYELLRLHTREEVIQKLSSGTDVMAALELLLRLRQACCDLSLLPGVGAEGAPRASSKLELLADRLKETVDAGHAALVFSQWTSLLDRIEPLLKAANLSFLRLDGSSTDRAQIVENFQKQDGPPVMLISLKAGGTGLTLTRADHVFIVDPWWNPAVEDQASARAHRIGQDRPVMVYRLVAKDTVEEKIIALQEKKRKVADFILSGQDYKALTREDLQQLLL